MIHQTNKNKVIVKLCEKCAQKQGKTLIGVTSFWEDICDVCLKETLVADIYDFVIYLKEDF